MATEQIFDAKVVASFKKPLENPFALEIVIQSQAKWTAPGDDRDLGFILTELRMRHPGVKDSR